MQDQMKKLLQPVDDSGETVVDKEVDKKVDQIVRFFMSDLTQALELSGVEIPEDQLILIEAAVRIRKRKAMGTNPERESHAKKVAAAMAALASKEEAA